MSDGFEGLGPFSGRVMQLRKTTTEAGGKVWRHRLYPPAKWDGFMDGDVLRQADGFIHVYKGFEWGSPHKRVTINLHRVKPDKDPPLVFHWAFICEACGKRALIKCGASWRPHLRKCLPCAAEERKKAAASLPNRKGKIRPPAERVAYLRSTDFWGC